MSVTTIEIVSFGYLHGATPEAHLTLDLRRHFRDPHVDPALRHQTAHDLPVRQAVMATPGIRETIAAAATLADAYDAGPSDAPMTIAVGCAGGRHRAATVAMALADRLRKTGVTVVVTHRDLDKPVVERTAAGEAVAPAAPVVFSWEITFQYRASSGYGTDILTLHGTQDVRPGDTRTATRKAIRDALDRHRPETRNASVLFFSLEPDQLLPAA
ncbi:RapZ C-terminal domain-containing protein [Kitasatospora sp. cg17-2]